MVMPITIVTSLFPARIEHQQKAVSSWLELGLKVVSLNISEELKKVKPLFAAVDFLEIDRPSNDEIGSRIYLNEIFSTIKTLPGAVFGIVNSDIIFSTNDNSPKIIKEHIDNAIIYGSRSDLSTYLDENSTEYPFGFDYFFFHKDFTARVSDTEFCLGMPVWDYWLPLAGAVSGFTLKRLISPVAFHIKHDGAWTEKDHDFFWPLLERAVEVWFYNGKYDGSPVWELLSQLDCGWRNGSLLIRQYLRCMIEIISCHDSESREYVKTNKTKMQNIIIEEPTARDKETPFFTILINAFNYGQYVEQAIRTALNQTIPPDQFEVIVIDDGSTDDTSARVANFGDSVRYSFQENAGQAAAFNAGLALARGDFVAFLDADDFFAANKLKLTRAYIETNPEIDLLYHPLVQVDETAKFLGIHPQSYTNQLVRNPIVAFLEGNLPEAVPTSGIVARTKVLRQLLPVPPAYRICADSYIAHTAPLIVAAIGYFSEPLAYYRLHTGNHFCRFDENVGYYFCKEEKLLLDKLALDVEAIECIASRFSIDIAEYKNRFKIRLILQTAVCIREVNGTINAIKYFFQNLHCLDHLSVIEKTYRFCSILFRLISGPETFRVVASKYLGSFPYRLIHKLFGLQTNRL
jgi:glycosyltransferase involved in cell wall biosynthesis